MPPYRSGDPSLDAVLLPLLARAEPGRERALDLEHARLRLLRESKPGDAAHLVALLCDEALDLGTMPARGGQAALSRAARERRAHAEHEHAVADRVAYLDLIFAAAYLHEPGQARLAALLDGAHAAAALERIAFQIANSSAPLSSPLRLALERVLGQTFKEPSAEQRNLVCNAARALLHHLPPAEASEALSRYLTPEQLALPGGIARAQMILADLDTEKLGAEWRATLASLLRHPALAPFVGDLLTSLPPDPGDVPLAIAVLDEQLARGEFPDNYVVWLLARAADKAAVPMLLRLLDADHDPDWPTILGGLKRAADPAAAEPLLRWIDRHRKRTGRPSSWEGFEAARALARELARRASAG